MDFTNIHPGRRSKAEAHRETVSLSVVVAKEQKELLQQFAEDNNITLSEAIRIALAAFNKREA